MADGLDFKSLLSNKWVLGGGLALGVLVLVMSRGSAAPVDNSGQVAIALNTIASANNKAALDYQASVAGTAAAVSQTAIAGNTQRDLGVIAMIANVMQNSMVVASRASDTRAGIINNQITTSTARQLDQQQGLVRLLTSYNAGNVALQTDRQDNALTASLAFSAADVTKTGIASNERIQKGQQQLTANGQILAANTSVDLARINGATTLGVASYATMAQGYAADASVKTAGINGQTAQNIANTNAISNVFANIFNIIGKFI